MATVATSDRRHGPTVMAPRPFRIARRSRAAPGIWALELEPIEGEPLAPAPGQFVMVYGFGVGEVAISVSGVRDGRIQLTIAALGAATTAICGSRVGTAVGVRGPVGNGWPLELARGHDVVVVSGGVGMAPLRPAVRHVIAHRGEYRGACLLYGSRTPHSILFEREAASWRTQGIDLDMTVDVATSDWPWRVGFVSELVADADVDSDSAIAMVCGPEVMMRLTARALVDCGVAPERVYVSLERSMRCGIAHCGHCQLGPTILCRDGPVYTWDRVEPLLRVREL